MKIDIIIDTVCPWCFVGKRRIERALATRPVTDVEVGWRPFQLNPQMPAGGMGRHDYLIEKFGSVDRARLRYRPIEDAGVEEGIDFRFDLIGRTPSSVDSHRLVRYAGVHGLQTEMVGALFSAYFTDGKDIGELPILSDIAGRIGLDSAQVLAYLESGEDTDIILAEDEMARGMGVGGVPCYIIDRRYAISGAQTPEVFHQMFDLARQDSEVIAAE